MINKVKILNLSKKNHYQIFNILLFFYFIVGFYFSIHTGVSHDEVIEQKNWRINFDAIKDIFGNNDDSYLRLLNYKSKYYGIGFSFLSQIYLLLAGSIIKLKSLPEETSRILLSVTKDPNIIAVVRNGFGRSLNF